jgi:hypothetical protein
MDRQNSILRSNGRINDSTVIEDNFEMRYFFYFLSQFFWNREEAVVSYVLLSHNLAHKENQVEHVFKSSLEYMEINSKVISIILS